MLVFPGEIHHLGNFRFGNFVRIDAALTNAMRMHMHHDNGRSLAILLEKPLYNAVASLADEEGVSMSTKARDLIREALEHLEDVALAGMVEARSRKPAKLINSNELRRRLSA